MRTCTFINNRRTRPHNGKLSKNQFADWNFSVYISLTGRIVAIRKGPVWIRTPSSLLCEESPNRFPRPSNNYQSRTKTNENFILLFRWLMDWSCFSASDENQACRLINKASIIILFQSYDERANNWSLRMTRWIRISVGLIIVPRACARSFNASACVL